MASDSMAATDEVHDAQVERKLISQAHSEGHDADIPSLEDYILTAAQELERRKSNAKNEREAARREPDRDIEKGDESGGAVALAGNTKSD